VAGSADAMGAISTTPAPTRLRRLVPLLVPVDPRRPVSRLTSTWPVVGLVRLDSDSAPPVPVAGAPRPAEAAEAADGVARGAIPQVSQ
jgi:hypothetical protein